MTICVDVLQLTHLSIWGSIFSWFLFLLVYSHMWPTVDLAPEMVGMVSTHLSFHLEIVS